MATNPSQLPAKWGGTQIAKERLGQKTQKTFPQKAFTTEPKLRRLVLRKQQTVRNRVFALQESFYPTTDVPYNAVKTRMATLLGICDRMSVLAYLGRPECASQSVMDQTVRYLKSGATVPKRHYFKRKLPAKKGYIEVFGVGYVYVKDGEWFIHWNHTEQLTFAPIGTNVENLQNQFCKSSPAPPQKRVDDEGSSHSLGSSKCSKEDFSLSYKDSKGSKQCTPSNLCEHGISRETEKRERYSKRERNLAFCVKSVNLALKVSKNEPSLRDSNGRWLSSRGQMKLNELEKTILYSRVSKRGASHG